MFGLTKLLGALTGLADNLSALSATVAEVNAGVRGRLGLDGGGPARGVARPWPPAAPGRDGGHRGGPPGRLPRPGGVGRPRGRPEDIATPGPGGSVPRGRPRGTSLETLLVLPFPA
jgi:hypothetical protein